MNKWNVVLSTTEPYNYIGMVKVRQGNVNTEKLTANIVENSLPIDLSDCKVTFQAIVGNYPIERPASLVDAKNGIISYTFDKYAMQIHGEHTANFAFYKGDDLIGTTQNFQYFVIRAVSKTPGEMGSYWQTVDDLIADMTDFIHSNQGDFTDWIKLHQSAFNEWFDAIKEVLKSIDPGGVLLNEIIEARTSTRYGNFPTVGERLEYSEKVLQEISPNGDGILIKHQLNQYPYVLVTTWENGFGINGIGTSTAFGSVPETIPSAISYPDKQTILVKIPKVHQLSNPMITESTPHSFLLVDKKKSLRITLTKEGMEWN